MNALPDPTDAQIEAYRERQAGRVLSPREADGQAADQWANYGTARRRAHIGELHELTRLRTRLRLAEDCAALFRDHLAGCVDTPRETDALAEWEYAAGVQPVPDGADDYPRAEDMA